jgi:predicted TIM-barrel fold metal-dependent hydrolase
MSFSHREDLEIYPIKYRKDIMLWDGEKFTDWQINTKFIFDIHTHPTKSFYSGQGLSIDERLELKKIIGFFSPFSCTLEEQLNIMKGDNIAGAAIFFGRPSTLEILERKNKYLSEVVKAHPELVAFALSPSDGRDGTYELIERAIKEYGLKGIGEIYPSNNLEGLNVVFEAASRFNVPVVLDIMPVHTPELMPTKMVECENWLVKVLPSYPELTLIIAHIGYLRPKILEVMKSFKNVYADISLVVHFYEAKVAKIIEDLGSERFLFGSDFGAPTCWTPYDDIIRIERFPLSKKDIENILGLNARRLLSL